MYDKKNIIIMAKLAVYDSSMSEKDYNKNQYFRHDYIYRQNMWIRFFTLLGSLILVGFYILHLLAIENRDIFDMIVTDEYKQELYRIAIFIIAVQVFYSIIGTIIYTAAYEGAQKRIRKYFVLVRELERRTVVRKRLLEKKRAQAAESSPLPPRRTAAGTAARKTEEDVKPTPKAVPKTKKGQPMPSEDRLVYRKYK